MNDIRKSTGRRWLGDGGAEVVDDDDDDVDTGGGRENGV